MKKLFYSLIALSAVLACNKAETPSIQSDDLVKISITGTLDNELTKTAYDAEGKMTWVSTDQISLIITGKINSEYNNNNIYYYTLGSPTISNDGRTAEFSTLIDKHKTSDDFRSSGFAIYPANLAADNMNSGYDAIYIKYPSTVSGEISSTCLVGTPNDSDNPTNFNFKTGMGVLKLTINNIPAETACIKLCTADKTNYPVDGDFSLAVDGDGNPLMTFLPGWVSDFAGYQKVDLSSEGFISSRDFYFNIPVKSYLADKLSIVLAKIDGTPIVTKTIKKKVNIARNECLAIPELNAVPLPFVITEHGYTPKIHYWKTSTQYLRFDVNTEALTAENYNTSDWVSTNAFTNSLYNSGDYTLAAGDFSTTGTYYLNYIVLKNSSDQPATLDNENVVSYGALPIYFLKSDIAKNAITALTVSSSETSTTYGDNGGSTALWDGNVSTYWHSKYSSGPDVRSNEYGAYMDLTLTNSITKVLQVKYTLRPNSNAQRPYKVVFGYSTDNGDNYTRIPIGVSTTEMKNAAAGATVTLPGVAVPESCSHVRIGIIESAQGVISASSSNHYAALAEVEVYSY